MFLKNARILCNKLGLSCAKLRPALARWWLACLCRHCIAYYAPQYLLSKIPLRNKLFWWWWVFGSTGNRATWAGIWLSLKIQRLEKTRILKKRPEIGQTFLKKFPNWNWDIFEKWMYSPPPPHIHTNWASVTLQLQSL